LLVTVHGQLVTREKNVAKVVGEDSSERFLVPGHVSRWQKCNTQSATATISTH